MTIEKGIDSKANTMGVKEVVEGAVPEASVLSNVSSEMTFRLPLDASDRFPGMFTELDKKIDVMEELIEAAAEELDEAFEILQVQYDDIVTAYEMVQVQFYTSMRFFEEIHELKSVQSEA